MMPSVDNNKDLTFADVLRFISNLWKCLLKYKYLILSVSLIFAIGLGFYQKSKVVTYSAKTTLLLNSGNKKGGGLSALASQLGVAPAGASGVSEDLLVELAKSGKVIHLALFQPINDYRNAKEPSTLLIDYFVKVNQYDKIWDQQSKFKNFKFKEEQENINDKFLQDSLLQKFYATIAKNYLTVSASKEGIITIITTSEDEVLSKSMCDNLVNSIEKYFIQKSTSSQRKTVSSIEDRVETVRKELMNKESQLANIKDGSIRVVKAVGKLDEIRLEREIQILTVMYAEVIKNLEIAKFNLSVETPAIEKIDGPEYPLTKQKGSFMKGAIIGGFLGFLFAFIFAYFRDLVIQTKKENNATV